MKTDATGIKCDNMIMLLDTQDKNNCDITSKDIQLINTAVKFFYWPVTLNDAMSCNAMLEFSLS